MRAKTITIPLSLIVSLLLFCTPGKNALNASNLNSATIEIIATNLSVPWGIDFLPDNTLIFTERNGSVKSITDTIHTIGTINTTAIGEGGLQGIAVDPEFADNNFIYLYYTYNNVDNLRNRVSRFTLKDTLSDEFIILDSIPGSRIHNGGRIAFGPDGLLYVTTGDAANPSRSRDTANLGGKILRLSKDGSIPEDNPFNNYVYAYGLRNPQGIAWQGDILYATDHGPNKHDEINQITLGNDYGWPQTCNKFPALYCYPKFTLAPAGAAISGDFLFITCLRGKQLRKINLTTQVEEVLFSDFGRLRALTIHNDYLYFGTSNRDGRGIPEKGDDKILRIRIKK